MHALLAHPFIHMHPPRRLTLDLIRKDVELKSLLAEFEGRKTGLEKNHMEFAREREQELLNMRQVVDRESKMRLEQSREVCSGSGSFFVPHVST
jgi:hypothetical protein